MTEYEARRTLVKSPPELWAELSDQVSLAGHLAEPFGEIRITRLEPETAVAWEGERASGTVRIEPSGWGTRVTLTARAVQADLPEELDPPPPQPEQRPPEPAPPPPPAPAPEPLPPAATRPGLFARLRAWFGGERAPSSREAPPAAESPPPAATPAVDPDAVLAGVLDKLGAAHHRPFSRA